MSPPSAGAAPGQRGTTFGVWAPHANSMDVRILTGKPRTVPLRKSSGGYWRTYVAGIKPGTLYKLVIDGTLELPDPASAFQPEGIGGPSQVFDHAAFAWSDQAWAGIPLEEMIIYELHPGTFTTGGIAGIVDQLDYLKNLGINAVELMPSAQFPGTRNWGYDGVFPYAVQNSYGGPAELQSLVNACHQAGLAVILDVVYNHLGPEGNHLGRFGPYFTDQYRTPWGMAINYDGPGCHEVRQFFIRNALYWFAAFHIDALRLDAVHGIFDSGARHILAELADTVAQYDISSGRNHYLIAESDLNDTRLIKPHQEGGYAIDAQWSDDFHHALHTLLTGENHGYYRDFHGFPSLAKAYADGFVYDWAWSVHRNRPHGSPSTDIYPGKFVVCAQNHDQVGNRPLGERLTSLTSFKRLKLAAAAVLLGPYIPLLFMGEEYAETRPFLYFVSHGDRRLIRAVRAGRRRDLAACNMTTRPPDPQSPAAFERSRLDWTKPTRGRHAEMFAFYQKLTTLRKSHPSLGVVPRADLRVTASPADRTLSLLRHRGRETTLTAFNFGGKSRACELPAGHWSRIFASDVPNAADAPVELPVLAPESCQVFRRIAP